MTRQQLDEVIRLLDLCLQRVPMEDPPTDPADEGFRAMLLAAQLEALRIRKVRDLAGGYGSN